MRVVTFTMSGILLLSEMWGSEDAPLLVLGAAGLPYQYSHAAASFTRVSGGHGRSGDVRHGTFGIAPMEVTIMRWRNPCIVLLCVLACAVSVSIAQSPPEFLLSWDVPGAVDVIVDENNRVYVVDSLHELIMVYTDDGIELDSWSPAPGRDVDPEGIAVDLQGNVYVAREDSITKFTPFGTFMQAFGSAVPGYSLRYTDVAIDQDGRVYGLFYDSSPSSNPSGVARFSAAGTFETYWGGRGNSTGYGEIGARPKGLAVTPGGEVYVADTANFRVQVFTRDGFYLRSWGTEGIESGQFLSPTGIALDAAGHVFVSDQYDQRIQMFSANGVVLTEWGNGGITSGLFMNPRGISIGPDGDIYVVDNQRIQKFGAPPMSNLPEDPRSLEGLTSYPNPFNPRTTIEYTLEQAGTVTLRVYDLQGRQIKTLVEGYIAAGGHETSWDGRDALGSKVACGVYMARLETDSGVKTEKLMLTR